jgi:rhodanese-related sulfurtransferase
MANQITRNDLIRKLATTGSLLLEALPERYYLDAHLLGAKLLPHDQVDTLAQSVAPDKGSEIVVYCASRSCQNSHIAANRLLQLGYTKVSVYSEGKQDWINAGLPVDSGVNG